MWYILIRGGRFIWSDGSFSTQILGALTAAVFAVGDLLNSFVGEKLLLQQETDSPDQGGWSPVV